MLRLAWWPGRQSWEVLDNMAPEVAVEENEERVVVVEVDSDVLFCRLCFVSVDRRKPVLGLSSLSWLDEWRRSDS